MASNKHFTDPNGEVKAKNAFLSSLNSFGADDIKRDPDRDKYKSVAPLIMRSITLALALGVFCYSIYGIAERMIDNYHQQDLYNEIRPDEVEEAQVGKASQLREPARMYTLLEALEYGANLPVDSGTEESDSERFARYHAALKNINSRYEEVYGWIVMTGTAIDYPIMIGKDNDFFLHHNYKGEATKAGSIFADYSLSRKHLDNLNTLIYGHCMKNGSMFRGLKTWYESANRNTLAENMRIEIYTLDAVYIYELFSAYRSNSFNFDRTYFSNSEDYLSFLKDAHSRSALKKKMQFDVNSKITTLVTCSNVNSDPDDRYVVVGILRQIVPLV